MKFFSPDSLHINKKNFASVHEFMANDKHEYTQHTKVNHLIALFGNYRNTPSEIVPFFDLYVQFDRDLLFNATSRGFRLFDLCRQELLSFVLSDDSFFALGERWTTDELFDFLFLNFRNDLVLNVAVAAFWLDYWYKYFDTAPKYDVALIFSGSLTYARSLSAILSEMTTRVFVLETFFTGNEFYCEERFSSIPNESHIKSKSFYNSIVVGDELDKDLVKAINKICLAENLNVVQPPKSNVTLFPGRRVVLVVGQVANDFSILGYDDVGFNSVIFYIKLISKIINDTDYCVVFKAHPWEHKKANLKTPFTRDRVEAALSTYVGDRLLFVDDFNIEQLFERADHVVMINSQSGIEAAWHGLRPITLGNPFYGNKGFTSDFSLHDLDGVVNYIDNKSNSSVLTLEEYKKFEIFLVRVLQYHLVSKFKSGIPVLRKLFSPFDVIQLVTPVSKNVANSTNVDVPSKMNVDKPQSQAVLEKKEVKSEMVNPINMPVVSGLTPFQRKMRKLRRDPKRYFADSKFKILRILAKLF